MNGAGLRTRRPTGQPSWPILLVAGCEKAGKSYAAAAASASDLVGRTLWVGVGEDDPDEYGAIPGAQFEIVVHDGSYRGILAAVTAAAAEPVQGDKPTLIVLDSATRLWNLLSEEAQHTANRRAAAKASRSGRSVGDEDATVNADLWNTAAQRWAHVMDVLRAHQGPSVVTARLDHVMVVNDRGEPTKDKQWKVAAHKSLPYDVGAIVELHARDDAYLRGVRSLRFRPGPGERTPYPDFTIDGLWRSLGLGEGGAGHRTHSGADGGAEQRRGDLLTVLADACDAAGHERAAIAARWAEDHDGEDIRHAGDLDALAALVERLRAQARDAA